LDEAASKISAGSGGLIFTPWLSGEKTPIDDDTIRGGFHNLSIEHTRDHMVRAVMEGVALNIRWAFRCMEKKIGEAKSINFVGGGAKSEIWCQIIADVLNRQVRQIDNPREAGARGAAMISAVAMGMYKDFSAAARRIKVVSVFTPNPKNARLYDRFSIDFKKLYKSHKSICKDINRRSS
jgi:xylulokinase